MHPASRVLSRLDGETRALHAGADWPWLELMSLEASRVRYVNHLIAIYGFEAPVEAALALTPHIAEVIELRVRSRSGLIVEDLLALDVSAAKIARLPECRAVAPFRDPTEAFGWLYVLERATLLHDTVRLYMEPRMPMVRAWSYLSASKGVATTHWYELGRALDAYAITDASVDHIVAAARTGLTALCDWHASNPAQAARASWDADRSQRFARE